MRIVSLLATLTCFACLCEWQVSIVTADDAKNDSVSAQFQIASETTYDLRLLRKTLAPRCDSLLETVLTGRWVPKQTPSDSDWKKGREMQTRLDRIEEELDEDMRFLWKEKGIPADPWSSTTMCGYYRQLEHGECLSATNRSRTKDRRIERADEYCRILRRATKLRPSIGTWCDPNGPKPCCSDLMYGRCVAKNSLNGCTCSKCVNVQNMKHAELMDWKPLNQQCKWHQYTPEQACQVLETSPVRDLYIVGDSFVLNMFMSMQMLLTGKPVTGSWPKEPLTKRGLEICSDYGIPYWLPCRRISRFLKLDDLLHRDSLCGDGRNVSFNIEYKKYYSSRFGTDFKEFVRGLLGRNGTYIVVGIGYHVQMRLDLAIDHFMKPAVDLVNNYYRRMNGVPISNRWPQFIFSFPMEYSILKPTRHLKAQYITKQLFFQKGMRRFCERNSIPILDFNPLAKGVISWDGIHYGIGVNMVKTQILLNYFASLPDM